MTEFIEVADYILYVCFLLIGIVVIWVGVTLKPYLPISFAAFFVFMGMIMIVLDIIFIRGNEKRKLKKKI